MSIIEAVISIDHSDDVAKWFENFELVIPKAVKSSAVTPWLSDLMRISILRRLVLPSQNDETGPSKLVALLREIVDKRLSEKGPGKHRDLMGSFIRHGVSQADLVSEATLSM